MACLYPIHLGEASVGISTQTRKTLTSAHGGVLIGQEPTIRPLSVRLLPTTPCWWRSLNRTRVRPVSLNSDGYGEHNDGSDFDGTSVGRARLHASRSPPCFNLGPAFPACRIETGFYVKRSHQPRLSCPPRRRPVCPLIGQSRRSAVDVDEAALCRTSDIRISGSPECRTRAKRMRTLDPLLTFDFLRSGRSRNEHPTRQQRSPSFVTPATPCGVYQSCTGDPRTWDRTSSPYVRMTSEIITR
ncbi:UNVERIFIED_ORG: hypothetical protein BDU10_9382 [Burkholderia sp. CF145]